MEMEYTLYLAKKIIGRLLSPLCLGLMAWALGLWLARPSGRRGRRGGFALLLAAGVMLTVLSLPVVGQALLAGLAPDTGGYADAARLRRAGVKTVVVLGGGVRAGRLSLADRLDGASLSRLMEGMRLWRELPGAILVLSGGPTQKDSPAEARAMAGLALELGVPPSALVLEDASLDTADQARLLAGILGNRPFALVTHNSHMPRALMLFRAQGLEPLPAAMNFARSQMQVDYRGFIPSPGGLADSGQAFYEYLGRLVASAKAWL